jgi:hypothetical protein
MMMMMMMTNTQDIPKQAFAGKKKIVNNITLPVSPLGHQAEGYSDIFFLTTAHEYVIVDAPSSKAELHKMKPAEVWRYQTKFCHIIHLREGNKIVEGTLPSSIRTGSGQCKHLP